MLERQRRWAIKVNTSELDLRAGLWVMGSYDAARQTRRARGSRGGDLLMISTQFGRGGRSNLRSSHQFGRLGAARNSPSMAMTI
jgi:hypothetical protein